MTSEQKGVQNDMIFNLALTVWLGHQYMKCSDTGLLFDALCMDAKIREM